MHYFLEFHLSRHVLKQISSAFVWHPGIVYLHFTYACFKKEKIGSQQSGNLIDSLTCYYANMFCSIMLPTCIFL